MSPLEAGWSLLCAGLARSTCQPRELGQWSHRAAAVFFVLYMPTRVWCACGRGVRSDTLRVARVAARDPYSVQVVPAVQRVQLQDQDAGGLERAHARAPRARLGARDRSLYTLFSDSCVVTRMSVCACSMFIFASFLDP